MSTRILGVYKITSPSGKFYIGSSIDVPRRLITHRSQLRNSKHVNTKLQNAWNKYDGCLSFEIILDLTHLANWLGLDRSKSDALVRASEQWYIDTLDPYYNIQPSATGGPPPGRVCLPETRAKISEANRGRKHTLEHRSKLSEAKIGVQRSEEAKSVLREGWRRARENGYYGPMARTVVRIDTGEVFPTARLASAAIGKYESYVAQRIANYNAGRSPSSKWEYVN